MLTKTFTSGPKFPARTKISVNFSPGGPKFSAVILVPGRNYRGPIFQWQDKHLSTCMCAYKYFKHSISIHRNKLFILKRSVDWHPCSWGNCSCIKFWAAIICASSSICPLCRCFTSFGLNPKVEIHLRYSHCLQQFLKLNTRIRIVEKNLKYLPQSILFVDFYLIRYGDTSVQSLFTFPVWFEPLLSQFSITRLHYLNWFINLARYSFEPWNPKLKYVNILNS